MKAAARNGVASMAAKYENHDIENISWRNQRRRMKNERNITISW
jgi:hypothetical protein